MVRKVVAGEHLEKGAKSDGLLLSERSPYHTVDNRECLQGRKSRQHDVGRASQMVVTVVKYKTLTSQGSAHLVLSPTICKFLRAFPTFMQNKIPGPGTGSNDHVFFSSTWNSMSCSIVSP